MNTHCALGLWAEFTGQGATISNTQVAPVFDGIGNGLIISHLVPYASSDLGGDEKTILSSWSPSMIVTPLLRFILSLE